MLDLPKAYEPSEHEGDISARERESGLYTPENVTGDRSETFSIVLPPPNATGTLHLGHAVMLAVEDIMVRFARMRGKKALWIPGTDHAAIATQVKVEKLLKKEEGKSRFDLGREAFLQRVDAFVENSRATINAQVRAMGCSIDWTREAFTLDAQRNLAVRTMFKRMYDDGLIYRGHRVVNWDPVGQTVISDDELVYEERQATLYTFRYSKDFPIPIATTRPETKVGDTAVAVHPDDERYAQYVGQTFSVEFAGAKLTIRVIADAHIDREFGTGALGVTPAHSVIDADMAVANDLPTIPVIGEDATMLPAAGGLVAGLSVAEARAKVVEWLRTQNLLNGEESVTQNVSTAERTGAIVEPLPKLQWFVNVNAPFAWKRSPRQPMEGFEPGQQVTLKQVMVHAVESKQIKIIPESFEKTYFHWTRHLRDWCISRQLWYGHRVPAWYRGDEVFVGVDAPEGEGWVQDEDTLDTWFSSGMWTFSTLGWPDESAPDLAAYHPTTMLETGRDILFFWVARMILMSTYALGEVPFRFVYLHGLVRDDQGRKMSKSLDNIIDPLSMIARYGTDATRLSLVIGLTPGNDVKLSEEKIAGFRNFTNKLWNIGRFVLQTVNEPRLVADRPTPATSADAWILRELHATEQEVARLLDEPVFLFSQAGERLRDFTWGTFADWYIEAAKVQRADATLADSTDQVLLYVLQATLKLWHPFMPFVTQRLWQELSPDWLLVQPWPTSVLDDAMHDRATVFESAMSVVKEVRSVRAAYRVPASATLKVHIEMNAPITETERQVIERLGRCQLTEAIPEGAVMIALAGGVVHISFDGAIDVGREQARLKKELEEVEHYIASVEAKLANEGFTSHAPAEAVEKERQKLSEAIGRRDALRQRPGHEL